ncbi:MFS general substrate transporter [Peniophora sp. CONT]|nr:MFS general substrate transporter [Peniophora sp. CONT]
MDAVSEKGSLEDTVVPVIDYSDTEALGLSREIAIVGHPWRIKGPALACVLLMTLGSNFASSSISPLKSTLKKQLHINNAQYAVLDTADSLINTILPIISGIAIDYYGPLAGSMYSSIVIVIGAILCGVAASISSYPLLLVAFAYRVIAGQIIQGFGSTTIETVQSKMYAFYAVGGGLMGFIYGLDIGIGRVYNLMGRLTAVPIMQNLGSWSWTFWIGAIMCAVSFGINTAFFFYERTFPQESRVPTGRQAAKRASAGRTVTFKERFDTERRYIAKSVLALPAAYWVFVLSQLLQSGAVNTYSSNTADAISVTRNATTEAAGYTSSLAQVIPIVLTPVLGFFFDRFGLRMHWVTLTAALWVIVFALLAYTQVNALCPVLLGSFALAFNALPWAAIMPLIVADQANLGTAFGIYKALNNCGSVIMDVSAGAIQDRTPTGVHQYDRVFAFIIAIKSADIIYGALYNQFDRQFLGGVLISSDKKLRKMAAEDAVAEQRATGWLAPKPVVTAISLATVLAAIIVAWVLYLYYSV